MIGPQDQAPRNGNTVFINQNFNRRHSPNRRKTQVDAVVLVEDRSLPGVVVDVSLQGMRLSLPQALEPGTPMTIMVLDVAVPAIVHWSHGLDVGVHLLESLDRDTLIALETADDDLADFR